MHSIYISCLALLTIHGVHCGLDEGKPVSRHLLRSESKGSVKKHSHRKAAAVASHKQGRRKKAARVISDVGLATSSAKGKGKLPACRKGVLQCPSETVLFEVSQDTTEATSNTTFISRLVATLEKQMRASSSEGRRFEKAWAAFQSIQHLDARSALTFKETWSDKDTEILKGLCPGAGAFVEGELTTEAFRSRLPSMRSLEDLVSKKRVAIVGSGPSLSDHSEDIDNHPVVVRFNKQVGHKLESSDSGGKMHVHVMNRMIEPDISEDALQIDLESTSLGDSYCDRFHKAGKFAHMSKSGQLLMIRPSAYCGLDHPNWLAGFTRGFLFYWLVGRLFDQVDMYGMSEKDGRDHWDGNEDVAEPFLDFEHFLYKTVQALLIEERDASSAMLMWLSKYLMMFP
eukprot:TRINITY_DN62344_c0_g1_i1.p1 TRINITY_DN62344_c0_g1~~TRINITY_DN62344_c0_g1_i1.p1  ORF type:complete len:399 (+),score=51.32 TRINITY_DN62344_c0_g1_i1:116-1312(+)